MSKLHEDLKPEEPTLSELIELARQEREALLAKRGGGKGSARIKLERKRQELTEMLLKEQLPVATIRDLLARTGTEVNLKSLFKYLREELTEEYAEYLRVTQRGKRENRSKPATPPQQMSEAEIASVDAFLGDQADVGRGKQGEEETKSITQEKQPQSRTRIDPTAIGKPFEQMKAEAEAEALRLEQRYEDKF